MRAHNLLLFVPLMAACGEPDTKIVALSPEIVVAPGEVDFGPIVKLYSVSTDVQILNTGRGALDIESIELEVAGGYSDVFTVEVDEELGRIGPGGAAEGEGHRVEALLEGEKSCGDEESRGGQRRGGEEGSRGGRSVARRRASPRKME